MRNTLTTGSSAMVMAVTIFRKDCTRPKRRTTCSAAGFVFCGTSSRQDTRHAPKKTSFFWEGDLGHVKREEGGEDRGRRNSIQDRTGG